MNIKIVVAVLSLLGAPMTVCAQSVTYDFSGTGQICSHPAPGTDYSCVTGLAFTGTVSIKLLADGPSGPDSGGDANSVCDDNGWVQSHFVIRWDNSVFEPAPLTTPLYSQIAGCVDNNQWYPDAGARPWDRLLNGEVYGGEPVPGLNCENSAVLVRQSFDTSWLSDLSFDLSVTLAPGSDAINTLSFSHFCGGTSTGDFDRTEFFSSIDLTSLVPRASVTTVGIDIKPASHLNSVNPRSKGVIPVAILGSQDFDATQVDSSTIRFAAGDASPVGDAHVADVDGDGYQDVLLRFSTPTTGIECGSSTASLSGRTFDGQSFQGSDAVRTVGCGK